MQLTTDAFKKILLVVIMTVLAGNANADDVTDSIGEALEYYKNEKYSDAIQSLNYASQLIGQKKGGNLQSLLPAPLTGWSAEEATSGSNAAFLGGGVTAEKNYTKDEASVTVTIVTDSPLLQSTMMLFSNPMFATSDGGKLEKINGEKAIVKYDSSSKDGDINVVVANRFLVTVSGYGVSLEDLKAYASAIDFKKLASMP